MPPPPSDRFQPTTPFVGREFELDQLRRALDRARDSRAPQLATICGPAGAGKTRLAWEFTREIAGNARCLTAACLDYGDDEPLAPIREALAGAGIDSAAAATALFAGDTDSERASAVLDGLFTGRGADADALRWVLRRTLELLAADRPLVLVLDEIHHADPLLLDLLEHLPATPRPAPVLAVCLTRLELFDRRPDWGRGERHAFSLQIGGLEPRQLEELLDSLGALPPPVKERLIDASGGNPLFLEQLFELGRTTGGASSAPCLEALLAARLELLPDRERRMLEAAALVGTAFTQAELELTGHVLEPAAFEALVRRRLLFDDGEGRLRFRHGVVREVAYEEIDPARRIELHERLAASTAAPHGRPFHLERAARLRDEHAAEDAAAQERACEAAAALRARADTALARAELATAVVLLERAARLFPEEEARRAPALADLGQALLETGESERGLAALRDAAAQAAEGGDAQTHARARLSLHWAERFAALPPGWSRSTADAVSTLASELEAAGDEAGVARAWTMLASLLALQGQVEDARRLAERALEVLRRSGDARGAREALRVVADAFVWGPTPVDAAVARLEQAAAEDVPLALETALRARVAALRAAGGDAAGARADLATAERLATEAGIDPTPVLYWRGIAELWLGDAEAAERTLETARAAVDAMMRTAWATVPGLLAEACCRLGRYDDAARCAAECREFAADHDLQAQLLWRTVDARILGRRGDYEQATALARGALALAEGSTATAFLGDAELALTEVRLCAADVEGSTAAATRAAGFYAAKGMTAWEAKARRLLDELAAEPLPQGA